MWRYERKTEPVVILSGRTVTFIKWVLPISPSRKAIQQLLETQPDLHSPGFQASVFLSRPWKMAVMLISSLYVRQTNIRILQKDKVKFFPSLSLTLSPMSGKAMKGSLIEENSWIWNKRYKK